MELPKGGDVDINQLGNIFVSKDAFSSLVQRVTIAEGNIERHNKQVGDLENKFDNYYTKPEIDNMIQRMNQLINSLNSGGPVVDIKPSSDGNVDMSQFTM